MPSDGFALPLHPPAALVTTARLIVVCAIALVLLSTARVGQRGIAYPAEPQGFARVAPTEPEDAAATFRVRHGFRMELLAAEPLVTDPVAMCYDEDGRAYVIEMRDYPYTDKSTDKPFVERTSDLPIGRVRLLEDRDGDGRFDKSTVFAEELSWPTGVACWQGGIYVAGTPHVWYLKDTDDDGRANVRRRVFSGFRKFNVQAVINNLKWGLDHRIYGAGASNGGLIEQAAAEQQPPLRIGRQDFRFDPRTESLELLSGGARFGNTFDDWQNRFVCNIRNPLAHVVLPRRYLARNRLVPFGNTMHDAAAAGDTLTVYRASPTEPWRAMRARRWAIDTGRNYPRSETTADGYFTSASGVTIYRGAAYPPELRGNMFVGEVSGNLIHRQTVEPDGVTFAARRADPMSEFVASTDNWFRPVNFVNAPDGTLHVLDMYRETIEHPWSIPDDIKALVDLESGRDRGRIYRLAPPDFETPRPPRLGAASSEQLVAELENPHGWWRDTAQRLLFERQDTTAVEPLRRLLHNSELPLARLHALWSLVGLDRLTREDLLRALGDPAPGLREHAVRLAESRLADDAELLRRVLELAGDNDPRVRFRVAFALGEVSDPRAVEHLAQIAAADQDDPWIRAAVLSSAADCSSELLARLVADEDQRRAAGLQTMLRALARLVGARGRDAELDALLDSIALLAGEPDRGPRYELILGAAAGLKRTGGSLLSHAEGRPSSAGRQLVRHQFETAARDAANGELPVERRLRAVELVAFADFATARRVLAPLLDPREPRPLELAALSGLAAFRDAALADLLLDAYRQVTPAVRAEVVQALLARPERTIALLDAIAAGSASAADVPAARRALLLKHANPAIREQAVTLFGGQANAARGAAIADYRDALRATGDATRGAAVAKRECLICHRLGDEGQEVGPNLLTVRHRSPDELLTQILDPNREVAPNFVEYVVTRSDGRVATGVVAVESATSITLVRGEGKRETILRADVEAITGTGRSLMPEGLEKRISRQEMADLLAYLKGAR